MDLSNLKGFSALLPNDMSEFISLLVSQCTRTHGACCIVCGRTRGKRLTQREPPGPFPAQGLVGPVLGERGALWLGATLVFHGLVCSDTQ